MKKKILNNVTGLGYKNDLNYLKKLGSCAGQHHVQNQIKVLENNYSIHVQTNTISSINLTDLKDFFIK